MARPGNLLAVIGLVCALRATAAAAMQEAPQGPGANGVPSSTSRDGLRTFTLDKPAALVEAQRTTDRSSRAPLRLPASHDTMRTTVGLGYVQGADWGSEMFAGGQFKGIQVQLNTLITKGTAGVLFDNGSLSLFDPDRRWRFETGDIFSHLRGASRGARIGWQFRGGRRPAISFYGHRPGSLNRPPVVSYRDQIMFREQTLIDAEVASDKSYLLRHRLAGARAELEASYRSNRKPTTTDVSLLASVAIWRGVAVTGGILRSVQIDDTSRWRTIAVRLPLSRFFNVTVERAFTGTSDSSNTASTAMATFGTGHLRLFHRHEFGDYARFRPEFSTTIERQQTQSMASFMRGSRLNLTLQLATQRTDVGDVQNWEEFQASVGVTRSTTLRVVTSVPDYRNLQRFRAHLRQELPGRLALQADYGRLSAFQDVPYELDRTRFKVMLYKTLNVATPVRGAEVAGRVLDHTGRPVPGARVRLGPYSVDADATGSYVFKNVPRGDYDLSIDPDFLPADFAWDGRRLPLALGWASRTHADLLVAPLNAIHGRVYCDRNGNGRFDPGEAIVAAVIHLNDRVTATDAEGSYSFYNLWPRRYTIRLNIEKLPVDIDIPGSAELTVELGDQRPVTGADFPLKPKIKPIVFVKPQK